MKFLTLLSCVFLVAFIGQTVAERARRPLEPSRYHNRRPHRRPHGNPCGSNGLGDYKGGCDISVPVIVMPKGRPIMERVLEWFNCGSEMCRPSAPADTDAPTPTSPPTGSYPPEEPSTSPPSYPTGTYGPEEPGTSPPDESSYPSMATTEYPYWN